MRSQEQVSSARLEDPLRLVEILRLASRSKWLILLVLLLTLLATIALLSTQEPKYQVRARLLIAEEGFDQVSLSTREGLDFAPRIENELSVLISQPVAEDTVRARAWEETQRSLFRATRSEELDFSEYDELGLQTVVHPDELKVLPGILRRIQGTQPPAHRLHVSIDSQGNSSSSRVRVSFLDAEQFELSTPGPADLWDSNRQGPFTYEAGEPVQYEGLSLRLEAFGSFAGRSYVVQHRSAESAVRDLLQRVSARAIRRDSGVIELTYTDSDPRRAAEVANAICRNYLVRSVRLGRARAEKTAEFLEQQIVEQRALLRVAEDDVIALQAEHPQVIDVQASAKALIDRAAGLEVDHARAQLAMVGLQEAIEMLEDGDVNGLSRLDRSLPDLVSLAYIDEISTLGAEAAQLERLDAGRYKATLQDEVGRLELQAEEASLRRDGMQVIVEAFAAGDVAATAQLETELARIQEGSGTTLLLAELAALEARIAVEGGALMETHPEFLELSSARTALVARIKEHLGALLAGMSRNAENYAALRDAHQGMLDAIPGQEAETITTAIQELTARVQANLESQLEGVAAKRQAVEGQLEEVEQSLAQLPEHVRAVADPLRRRDTHVQLLGFLQSARQEADISREGSMPTARLIDPALPSPARHSPKVILTLMFGVLLGLILGMGLVFAHEMRNGVLHDEQRLEQAAGLPCFGVLPEVLGGGSAMAMIDGPLRAPLRIVRANLTHALDEIEHVRSLAVVSRKADEGCSLCNLGLAATFASPDARVLLVDADLGNGELHAQFDLPSGPGFSEVLSEGRPWEQCVQSTARPGLDLLPAGGVSSAILLDGARLRGLLEALYQAYDLVVLDLSPAGESADAHDLVPLIDSVVLAYRDGSATPAEVQVDTRRMLQAGARLVGLIFNGSGRS